MDKIEFVAKICHQVNKTYCEHVGDKSQKDWDDAPEWQRQSAVNGVKFILSNPRSSPADVHKSWMEQKLSEGWVWGEVKDAEKKTHPCLVPYSELPEVQKAKDELFKAVVIAAFSERVAGYGASAVEEFGHPV